MMKAQTLLTFFTATLVLNSQAADLFYLVKKGDELSHVLHSLNLKPLYGKRGSIAEVLRANPRKKSSQGNRIYPGEKIYFTPAQSEILAKNNYSIRDGEVFFEKEEVLSPPEAEPVASVKVPETKVEEAEDESYSDFAFRLSESYLRIDGKDNSNNSSGALVSKASPAFDFKWSPHLNQKFGLDLGLKYQSVEFSASKTKTLKDEKQSLTRIFLGANYQLHPKWLANLEAGQGDEILYRATNTDTIKVDKVPVPYVSAGARYTLAQTKSMIYALKGAYRLHLPFKTDDYTGSMGHGYLASILVEHKIGRYTLLGEGFYSQDIFPVKSVDYDRAEVGINLGVRIE